MTKLISALLGLFMVSFLSVIETDFLFVDYHPNQFTPQGSVVAWIWIFILWILVSLGIEKILNEFKK